MAQQPYTWTYSEYARFPDDGNRYVVLDVEVLVTPAPAPLHQRGGAAHHPAERGIPRVAAIDCRSLDTGIEAE